MKNIATVLTLCSLSFGPVVFAAQEDEYTNQIIQIQYDELGNEIRYPVVVKPSGQMDAPLPILFGVSMFELWSVKNDDPTKPILLDTTEVNGFYSPEIWIDTPDPNDTFSAPRTRADVAYSFRIEGVPSEYVDNAAGSLQMVWNQEDLPVGSNEFPDGHETDYSQGDAINSILPTVLTGSLVAYAYSDSETEVWSRETISLWEKNTDGTPMLSSRTLTVWPTATINFAQGKSLENGAVYSAFPEIQVNFGNLYAVDSWSLWVESESGIKIPLSEGVVTANTPQSRQVPISGSLTDKIITSGTYTLYAAQQAEGLDIEPNVVNMGTFTFTKEIKVRANVIGSE